MQDTYRDMQVLKSQIICNLLLNTEFNAKDFGQNWRQKWREEISFSKENGKKF